MNAATLKTALRGLLAAALLAPALCNAQAGAPATPPPIKLSETIKGTIDASSIEGLLLKSAEGQVSAASLAGVNADAVEEVHNLRDYNVMFKAFDKDASGVGFSVTPARTRNPFPSYSLKDYRESGWVRFVAGTSFSFAQGTAPVAGRDFVKQAVSVSSSAFFYADHDPVVVVAKSTACAREADRVLVDAGLDKPTLTEDAILEQLDAQAAGGDKPSAAAIQSIRSRAESGTDMSARRQAQLLDQIAARRQARAGDPTAADPLLAEAIRVKPEVEKATLAAFNTCADQVLAKLGQQWNRSRYAISFGTGTVKPKDGNGDSVSLGRVLAASVLYGFEQVPVLRDRAALTVTVRRAQREPVNDSLGTAAVRTRDGTLTGVRFSAGSSGFRALIEGNNRKSSEELGTTESTLRQALGLDLRVMDGAWLSLRYGKQRKVGGGDENASFLVLNLSPTALLDFKR